MNPKPDFDPNLDKYERIPSSADKPIAEWVHMGCGCVFMLIVIAFISGALLVNAFMFAAN